MSDLELVNRLDAKDASGAAPAADINDSPAAATAPDTSVLPQGDILPFEKKEAPEKEIPELLLLKAKVHQMALIDEQKSVDLFKARMQLHSIQLQQQQAAIEKELQESVETSKKFNWNTLSFGE